MSRLLTSTRFSSDWSLTVHVVIDRSSVAHVASTIRCRLSRFSSNKWTSEITINIFTVPAVATDSIVFVRVSSWTITHEPLHSALQNFAQTCNSITSRTLLNFKVTLKGEGHVGFCAFYVCMIMRLPADSTYRQKCLQRVIVYCCYMPSATWPIPCREGR